MSSKFCSWLCTLFVLATSGCAMCSNGGDYTYETSGGLWERLDPTFGRVGSAFTPEVGTRIDEMAVEGTGEEMIDGREPTPAEDPERGEDAGPAEDSMSPLDPAPPLPDSGEMESESVETSVLQDSEFSAH